MEKRPPKSGYKLLRYSNIRQNDFSGYEDEEACFDMVDKHYVVINPNPPVSAVTDKDQQPQQAALMMTQETLEAHNLEYIAE